MFLSFFFDHYLTMFARDPCLLHLHKMKKNISFGNTLINVLGKFSLFSDNSKGRMFYLRVMGSKFLAGNS